MHALASDSRIFLVLVPLAASSRENRVSMSKSSSSLALRFVRKTILFRYCFDDCNAPTFRRTTPRVVSIARIVAVVAIPTTRVDIYGRND